MPASKPLRRSDSKGVVGAPLISSAAIGIKYAKAIQELIGLMVRDTHRQLAAMFNAPGYALDDVKVGKVKDGSPSGRSRIIIDRLLDKYKARFDDLAEVATDRMIHQTIKHVDTTAALSLREMSKTFDLPKFWSPRLKEIVAASTQEATQLIKTIPEQFLAQVQGQTMRAITTGRGLADLTPFLAEKYGQNMRKAKNVALDQTRKAYSALASQRMQDAGVKKFVWKHSHGGHDPRKQHQDWDGKVFSYADPPVDDRFGPVLPGQAINCLPAESEVENADGLHKLFRRRYSGKLTTLVTESGETLKATPNHPVLTARGWKPIQSVQVGEYIVKTLDEGIDFVEEHIKGKTTKVRQLFDAAASRFLVHGATVGSLLEFHGDVSDGEIDVVDIDRLLPKEADSAACQFLLELVLSWADEVGDLETLPGDSSNDELVMRALHAPKSIVRRLGAVVALLSGHSLRAEDAGFTLASYVHARLDKAPTDSNTRGRESLRHLQLTQPCDVGGNDLRVRELLAVCGRAFDRRNGKPLGADELAEVVRGYAELGCHIFEHAARLHRFERVRDHVIEELSGAHVFNLETSASWYSSNGYIVHNCKCFARPVLDFGDDNE